MYKSLVVMHKVVTSGYFMDEMQYWEALELCNFLPYIDYASWEQTRILLSIHANKKKVRKLSDLMQFAWDRNKEETEITNEQKERLKMMAESYLKNKNNES